MPVQRILIGVIEIDTVVVVRLLGLPILLIAAERIAGRRGPSIVRL